MFVAYVCINLSYGTEVNSGQSAYNTCVKPCIIFGCSFASTADVSACDYAHNSDTQNSTELF